MNRHTALLSLAVFMAFAAVEASASTPVPTLSGTKTPEPAPRTLTPAAAAAPANPEHLFAVNDAKGLLLTCTAPELDRNAETDVFKGCTLAPGRTLDDVMHTFVQGIRYEQSQHEAEREEWQKSLEAGPAQTPAEK
jgi:hypothetical protein